MVQNTIGLQQFLTSVGLYDDTKAYEPILNREIVIFVSNATSIFVTNNLGDFSEGFTTNNPKLL